MHSKTTALQTVRDHRIVQRQPLSAILKVFLLMISFSRLDEALEDRVRPVRSGLELRVILDTKIELVARNLHLLNERIVRCGSCKTRAALKELCPVVVINLVSVSVAFLYLITAVALIKKAVRSDLTGVCTQTERAALVDRVALAGHKVDHLVCALLVELA